MDTDKIKNTLKNNTYLQGLVLTTVFFTALHCTFAGLFSDDEWFLEMIEGADSLGSLLIERYNTWTSRLLTEAVCFTLVEQPFFIWAVLDILVCILLYHCLTVLLINNKASKANIYVFLGLAGYPFMHMASAGWLSTTLNYLWPFTFALYALTGSVRILRGEKPGVIRYILYILSLIFAVNCEMPAAYVFLVFGGVIAWRFIVKEKNKFGIYELVALLISLCGIIFAFTCPGNAVRTEVELRWMPEFPDLSIFDKFRLCAVFVFEHFVAIPDAVFFLFSLTVFLGVAIGNDAAWKKMIAAVPLTIDIIFTSVYVVKDFIIGSKRSYDFSYPSIYMTDAHTAFVQISELLGLFIYIGAVIFSLFIIFKDARRRFISIWSLGSGFAVRMSLMLSATMFISWHRTLIYFYFGMIGSISLIADKIFSDASAVRNHNENNNDDQKNGVPGNTGNKLIKVLIYLAFAAGIIINIILTVGHQLRVK